VRIIGPPSAELHAVILRFDHQSPLALNEVVPALWAAALRYGVDPVGVVAQSAHETDWWRFTGQVKAEFRNTCGLKRNERMRKLFPDSLGGDLPLAHADFSSWTIGAEAHVQHICAYAGQPLPAGTLVVDPRYDHVKGKSFETWKELGGQGSWAPNPEYGALVQALAIKLRGR
jgi:N-acetylmuramoyl-L-alanine amidase